MAGYPCDMKKIMIFVKKNTVLEDCAHAWEHFLRVNMQETLDFWKFFFLSDKTNYNRWRWSSITNDKNFYKNKKLKAFGIDKDIKDKNKVIMM